VKCYAFCQNVKKIYPYLLIPIFFLLLSLSFPAVEETIPEGPFSYPGQSPREIIIVNPNEAPILEGATQDLLVQVEEEILHKTLAFVREELFDLDLCDEDKLWSFIEETGLFPEIPLDVFLDAKIGVCRHFALTATYLIEQLIREGVLKGEVFLIREDTPFGRHAWTLFLSEQGAWHIDAYWGVLENGKTDAGFSKLCHKYGRRVMESQKKRYEN